MRAVAGEVGIEAACIDHHFAAKDVIAAPVVNEGLRVVHDAVAAALDGLAPSASPPLRLTTAIKQHLLSSLEHSDYTAASIRAFVFLSESVRDECRQA